MRLVFAGTPDFARAALERLHAAGFAIPLVLTQPDRPAGRGLKLQPSPVKQFAQQHGIPVAQPRSLRLDGRYPEDAARARQALQAADADVMVVAAYGLILPQWVLDAPRLGCLNIHASLLPRWRGAAPIHRAIEAGDAETGVTIMQMDAGLDTGDMLLAGRIAVAPQDSTGTLHDRLAALGAGLIVEALELAGRGGLVRTPQPAAGASYARKIDKAEAQVDWSQPAVAIERRLRAFDPFPGATSALAGESVKLWRAQAADRPLPAGIVPGTVVAVAPAGIEVATGEGLLRLTELQRAGGKRLPAADFLRGTPVAPGQRFGTA
ncbi:methionyl-tRNA formyltransferase [Ramlibacter sp.]|uniref:methionyl-tRNA formyltransferase n=1 Tax=Ramlibacter sp. TaxID=1917967 RepID=UPI002FC6F895